jgi:3-methyladenine DNA glycosylase AlkD
MTAEEYLKTKVIEFESLSETLEFTIYSLTKLMEEYHESELKKLRVADVSRCFGEDDLRHVYEDVDTNWQSFEDWFKEYTSPI